MNTTIQDKINYIEKMKEKGYCVGNAIHEELYRQGRTVTWLAEQLCYTRPNLYKIFKKDSLDTDFLLKVSRILDRDFLQELHDHAFEEKEMVG